MPDAGPDVLVIGGGVVGLFCAYYLRLRGSTVTVVEAGEVGGPRSSSSGNTGFLGTHGLSTLIEPGMLGRGLRGLLDPAAPVSIRPGPDPELLRWLWHFRRACRDGMPPDATRTLLAMKRRGLQAYLELSELGGCVAQPGMIVAYREQATFRRACENTALRKLRPDELRELEPGTDFSVCGALYHDEGAFVRVPDFITGFGRLLTGMGVSIQSGTEVTGFGTNATTIDIVRTTRGEFRPGTVVLAAGAWSAACAGRLGLRLMVQPVRGYSITVRAPAASPARPVLLAEARAAVSPLGGELRFAGLLQVGAGHASARSTNGLRKLVAGYLPALADLPAIRAWTGSRPCTPDGLPYLGFAGQFKNLFVSAGHGAIGMGLAPATGEVAAQVIAGEPPGFGIAPFRLDRFDRS